MKRSFTVIFLFFFVIQCISTFAENQRQILQDESVIPGQQAKLGQNVAELTVPEDFYFFTKAGILKSPYENNLQIAIQYVPAGHISETHIKQMEPTALLKIIDNGTQLQNQIRQQKGLKPIEKISWFQKPEYDPKTHILSWIIMAHDPHTRLPIINIQNFIFTREGYISLKMTTNDVLLDQKVYLLKSIREHIYIKSAHHYVTFDKTQHRLAPHGISSLLIGHKFEKNSFMDSLKDSIAKSWQLLILIPILLFGLNWQRKSAPAAARLAKT